ncbi:PaaI family thioesterase [Marinobacter xestospongiae]|uniref:PaaI family thioesterase n=1 Tax=Marinobacter xestospongiae TaxID=994319 RepID=A0ABU3W045_9GAMM|nr:PaaI family thioesterase [Marinobacter xestospongiae]MDV2079909.1 PaaI family thioesterase [Marinobacter xestospongiae]
MNENYPSGGLTELLGINVIKSGEHWIELALEIGPHHFRPSVDGLHAGTVVTLADTACGFGCRDALPKAANGFITLELKSNLTGKATKGLLICRAEAVHLGRTTQVWSALVSHRETGRSIATFSCTQLLLY